MPGSALDAASVSCVASQVHRLGTSPISIRRSRAGSARRVAVACEPRERGESGDTPSAATTGRVLDSLRTVHDPEYPGVSVMDLGMIAGVDVDPQTGRVEVELIPTFSGCPALSLIIADIERAVSDVVGGAAVAVVQNSAAWDPSRLSERARAVLSEEFGVAVEVAGQSTPCPRCGERALARRSSFGPARCRAVSRCTACHEIIEVLRA